MSMIVRHYIVHCGRVWDPLAPGTSTLWVCSPGNGYGVRLRDGQGVMRVRKVPQSADFRAKQKDLPPVIEGLDEWFATATPWPVDFDVMVMWDWSSERGEVTGVWLAAVSGLDTPAMRMLAKRELPAAVRPPSAILTTSMPADALNPAVDLLDDFDEALDKNRDIGND
ncbi:hypothetical protein EK0264_03880 [Epidermidibacterium keratini]|uniref:Uncharacterized protein n=1 Tax=Epidermidibacterium keratini TaxID=1891644 RepID=A0A7L4YKZ6_9ACTN|nr:hypothetical protein [Epidermidibacterium keratini]QHB99508.1 hypothetical protein EK0264_03880 [Epidermidibacterium keratini]